nr:aldehyde dehydrogenase family protein [Pseudomonas sp. BIGb0427]
MPTLLIDPPEDARIMQDEIFGPLLIVVPYEQLSSAVGYINQRPRYWPCMCSPTTITSRTTCSKTQWPVA